MNEPVSARAVAPSPSSNPSPQPAPAQFAARAGAVVLMAAMATAATAVLGAPAAAAAWSMRGADAVVKARAAATTGTSLPAGGGSAVRPTRDALALAELVRARWMGVDRSGNLWAWEPVSATLRFFSPTAERLATMVLPQGTSAVEADTEWGAVALRDEGSQLVWLRPGQDLDVVRREKTEPAPAPDGKAGEAGAAGEAKPETGAKAGVGEAKPAAKTGVAGEATPAAVGAASLQVIDLKDPAGWVCWIDADTVAVSPRWTAHRIEIWSLRDRKLVRSIGDEKAIPRPPGTTRVRDVQLLYDGKRRLIYSLEGFTGDLRVFTLDGALAWSAKVDNPWVKVEMDRVAELDAKAKAHDTAFPIWFSDLWLQEGPDGSAWVRQQVDVVNQSVTLTKATARGKVAEQVGKLRCPGRTFIIWGDNLIFYRDIALPREVCNSVAPLP